MMSWFGRLKEALAQPVSFRRQRDQTLTAVFVLIGSYIALYGIVSTLKYVCFSYDDFDLAVHAQVMWNLAYRGSGVSSILGLNFLGNHAHLISFALVPLYRLLPHPLTLLWLQTLALGAAAFPLYLLARSVVGRAWSVWVVFLYVLYPGLAFTNLYEFHPTVFATFFLSWTLWMYHTRRFGAFALFLALAMLCQENIAFAAVGIGAVALLQRRSWFWSVFPFVFGGMYFVSVVRVLMPHYNRDVINFLLLYKGLGETPGVILRTLLLNPAKVLGIVATAQKGFYITSLFLPVAFLPILHPVSLVAVLPFLSQHLLSTRPSDTQIYFHYTAEIIPFIFYSFIFGLDRLLKRWNAAVVRWPFIGFLFVVAVVFSLVIGPQTGAVRDLFGGLRPTPRDRIKEEMLAKIPPSAGVVATFEFLPHLANRAGLYSFHHVYTGFYTLSDKTYELPETTQDALIDFIDVRTFKGFYKKGRTKNLKAFFGSGQWGIEDVQDGIVLLRKGAPDRYRLTDVLAEAPAPQHPVNKKTQEGLVLLGFDTDAGRPGFLHLTLYWSLERPVDREIELFFDVMDDVGLRRRRLLRPSCYLMHPVWAWQPGTYVREEHYLPLTEIASANTYSLLRLGVSDCRTGRALLDEKGDDFKGINIASFNN